MKKAFAIFTLTVMGVIMQLAAMGQCAMCTKTAQQLGEKPAAALNSGILYLMLAPFAIVGIIAYKWWKGQKHATEMEA